VERTLSEGQRVKEWLAVTFAVVFQCCFSEVCEFESSSRKWSRGIFVDHMTSQAGQAMDYSSGTGPGLLSLYLSQPATQDPSTDPLHLVNLEC